MSFFTQNNKRAFILAMIALSFIVIVFSYFYYSGINNSKDPRVKQARELYKKYNEFTVQANYDSIFSLLDSIENIYKKYTHYEESFEIGVLYNNRAAAYLTMALHKTNHNSFIDYSKDSLLSLAQANVLKSIAIYEKWLDKFADLDAKQISQKIDFNYFLGLDNFTEQEKENFLKSRIKEIETSQLETIRRLSVSYTNLGIIYRHHDNYEEAIKNYTKAIEIWDQNLTAENNLNILLGKPLKKRNLIQKLFPPDKEK